MIIDFHTHTFPDKLAAHALEHMQSLSHCQVYTSGTASALTASMEAAGIDHSIVLPVVTNPAKASHINDISINNDPNDGLIYFGGIHPDTENWHQELDRIAQAGIKGIKLHPLYQNTNIDDIRYLRILGRAAELGLIVVMHAGDDPAFPGMVRCSPEMTRSALKQVDGLTLVMAHMGGLWNWDRVADQLADTGAYIDTSNALGSMEQSSGGRDLDGLPPLMTPEQFIGIVRAFGADRVLFASDSPWTDQKASVDAIKALPLTQEESDLIFYQNACRLLSI